MWNNVLLTGGAGRIGAHVRTRLAGCFPLLRITDRRDLGPARAGEEVLVGDMADPLHVARAVEGIDAVLHFAGMSGIHSFDKLLPSNILAMHHLYNEARRAGVKRIVFASSSHVSGFYPRDEHVTPEMPVRPDTLYGVTKVFGEALARFAFDKFGIETLCIRIGSCFPEPTSARMKTTWLSRDDLVRLALAGLDEPQLGFRIVYGASANAASFWPSASEALPGYQPQDSAEAFGDLTGEPEDPEAARYQGGHFATAAMPEDAG
jgi:uronate dehydrogenase